MFSQPSDEKANRSFQQCTSRNIDFGTNIWLLRNYWIFCFDSQWTISQGNRCNARRCSYWLLNSKSMTFIRNIHATTQIQHSFDGVWSHPLGVDRDRSQPKADNNSWKHCIYSNTHFPLAHNDLIENNDNLHGHFSCAFLLSAFSFGGNVICVDIWIVHGFVCNAWTPFCASLLFHSFGYFLVSWTVQNLRDWR